MKRGPVAMAWISWGIMMLGAVIGFAGLFLLNYPVALAITEVAAILVFLAGGIVYYIHVRCPHCGEHLGRVYGPKCPFCGKDIHA